MSNFNVTNSLLLAHLKQIVPDPMARYKQLLFYATKLEKMPDELHTPTNKVEGCVSQVRGVLLR
jgi:sulfur transfer protein SufE